MQDDLEDCLHRMGIETVEYGYRIENCDVDDYFIRRFREIITKENPDAVMMMNYISPLAVLCYELQIPYISWVYDCPFGLRNPEKTMGLKTNYIFFFDRAEMLSWKNKGFDTVYHLPLAVDTTRLDKVTGGTDGFFASSRQISGSESFTDSNDGRLYAPDSKEFISDVSFVGQMYRNQYDTFRSRLDGYMGGYVDALVRVQAELYGAYILRDSLESIANDDMREMFSDHTELYEADRGVFFNWVEHTIAKEITRRERLTILRTLSRRCHTSLYSPEREELLEQVDYRGVVSAYDEAPIVYNRSRINLNMTLKDITSGMSLRVLEILGSGGFLLSNWQPEIAENFVDGEEVVLYTSVQDAIMKALYYLEHEEERRQIAEAGRRAVERFSFENQVRQMLEVVFS